MPRKKKPPRPTRRSRKKKSRGPQAASAGEWVGGRLLTPFYITEGPEPYRPEIALWMELPEGVVVGQMLVEPGDETGALGKTLEEALQRPLVGLARRPSAIRVADATLAAEVRAVVGHDFPVTIAATPELDDVLDAMSEAMGAGADALAGDPGGAGRDPDEWQEASYLEAGRVSAAAVAELFAAAELLHHAAPWEVASDSQVLRLDVPELGVEGACVSIVGALGESLGLAIFPSLSCYHAFVSAASQPMRHIDLGTSWLSFTLERGADIPAAMRREVAEHGWPVADARSYPSVAHRDRDGLPRPLTERDVRLASACAISFSAFFAKHRDAFAAVAGAPPICESYSDERNLTVRFTLPHEAFELFDVDAEPSPVDDAAGTVAGVPKVGRNDPCPCGSGKKYKKCHLRADRGRRQEASKSAAIHELDGQLVREMSNFAMARFPDEWLRHARDFRDVINSGMLSIPWSVYHYRVKGRTLREIFLEECDRQLDAAERAWLAAQEDVWLSVWEVVEVVPGESLKLEDALTGEVRCVYERLASTTLRRRDALLGRIVLHEGLALLCGVHPRPLPPVAAAEVVRRARGRLRRKRAVPVERLRDEVIGRYLIRRWEEAVEACDERSARPPQLQNTDGDPLLITTDHFDLDPHSRGEVESRLAGLEGAEPPAPDDDPPAYVFIRHGAPGQRGQQLKAQVALLESTVIGRAWLSQEGLHVETNSVARADALRSRIEARCGDLIRHRLREHSDPLSSARPPAQPEAGEPATPPEAEQLVLDFKAEHYADWADHPLPALRGETPREACRSPRGREAVDLLLKDMEHTEQRMPAGARFDFTGLRRELGLDG